VGARAPRQAEEGESVEVRAAAVKAAAAKAAVATAATAEVEESGVNMALEAVLVVWVVDRRSYPAGRSLHSRDPK
jgi:hypothetical protein